jgi:hypothetical protein
MSVMISLVGEQPAPNVLPVRYFAPDQVALVCTDRTLKQAKQTAKMIGDKIVRPFCETEAYRLELIRAKLERYITDHGWVKTDLLFNLTGGTKTMVIAALEIARRLNVQTFYYQTEDNQSLIHPYRFCEGNLICETPISVEATLTIDEFLRLYIARYKLGDFKNDFERKVAEVLMTLGPGYEFLPNAILTGVGPNVEVDGVLRHGNTFAVIEAKLHAKKSEGIDQLRSVTDQRTLGTYTKRFLISADELHSNDQELAAAYRITVVVLPSGRHDAEMFSNEDAQRLIKAIRKEMEP